MTEQLTHSWVYKIVLAQGGDFLVKNYLTIHNTVLCKS